MVVFRFGLNMVLYFAIGGIMKLIQLAEKDAEEGIKTPQDKVFKDIEEKRWW